MIIVDNVVIPRILIAIVGSYGYVMFIFLGNKAKQLANFSLPFEKQYDQFNNSTFSPFQRNEMSFDFKSGPIDIFEKKKKEKKIIHIFIIFWWAKFY